MGIFAISNGASSNGARARRERKKGEPTEMPFRVLESSRVCTVCEPKEERRNNGLAKNGLKRTERRETKEKNGGRGGCGGVNEPRDTVWNGAIGMAKERGLKTTMKLITMNKGLKKLVEISRYPNLLLKFLTSGSDSSSF